MVPVNRPAPSCGASKTVRPYCIAPPADPESTPWGHSRSRFRSHGLRLRGQGRGRLRARLAGLPIFLIF